MTILGIFLQPPFPSHPKIPLLVFYSPFKLPHPDSTARYSLLPMCGQSIKEITMVYIVTIHLTLDITMVTFETVINPYT